MAGSGAKAVLIAAGVAGLAGLGYAIYRITQPPTTPPPADCTSPNDTTNCSTLDVGTFIVSVLPASIPSDAAWVPCIGTVYHLCSTTEYPGSFDPENVGAGTAIAPDGTEGTTGWSVAYSTADQWIAVYTFSDGTQQVYVIY